jgi:hypothetical protein
MGVGFGLIMGMMLVDGRELSGVVVVEPRSRLSRSPGLASSERCVGFFRGGPHIAFGSQTC